MPLQSNLYHFIFLHFLVQYDLLIHIAKFQSVSKNRSLLFWTVLFAISWPPLFGLVPELDLKASLRFTGSDVKGSTRKTHMANCHMGHSSCSTFITGKKNSIKMTGSRCVVQDCSNRSNHASGRSLHRSPAIKSEREKWVRFVRTHRANFNPSGTFVICSDQDCF